MTNALVYHVASGQAFFSGVALVALATLFTGRIRGRSAGLVRIVLAGLGLALIAASATPLPSWFYAPAGLATLAWLGLEGHERPKPRRIALALRWIVPVVWSVGLALELPFHLMPTFPRPADPTLSILGDSLAAGMGGEAVTWPGLLASRYGLAVVDLSVAGADVAKARRQADGAAGPGSLVLVEIGGNDILGATTPEAFERGLDALLAALRSGGRTVVLLELPLPPTFNRFGEIQRRLARRHGAFLVPKRFLLRILTTPGVTVDSIHLAPDGHARMAEAVRTLLRSALGDGPL